MPKITAYVCAQPPRIIYIYPGYETGYNFACAQGQYYYTIRGAHIRACARFCACANGRHMHAEYISINGVTLTSWSR